MQLKTITQALSVSAQISAADVEMLKAQGFRAIICNRPDHEGADQPAFAEIAEAAKKAGLEAAYLPIELGRLAEEDARAFASLLHSLPKPILAFCRSGTRSATLWSMSQALEPREG